MSKRQDHEIHKYKRLKIGKKGYEIYKCMLPGCSHYLPNVELAIGRFTQCWSCGNEVTMTQSMVGNLKTERPICESCKRIKRELRESLMTVPLVTTDENEYEGD